jgi:hypothetical protein
LRAPASSLLITFLTIKPSWSGLLITCAATSRMFLIFTIVLSCSIAGAPMNELSCFHQEPASIGLEQLARKFQRPTV